FTRKRLARFASFDRVLPAQVGDQRLDDRFDLGLAFVRIQAGLDVAGDCRARISYHHHRREDQQHSASKGAESKEPLTEVHQAVSPAPFLQSNGDDRGCKPLYLIPAKASAFDARRTVAESKKTVKKTSRSKPPG